MKDKTFIDTNIFIYSINGDEKDKLVSSKQLIKEAIKSELGIISFQVVQEFINTSKRKFQFSVEQTREFCKTFLFPLWEIYPTRDFYLKSLDVQNQFRYSFYDSLIIAAALEANCKILYSEDLHHNHKIENLTILNPFK